MMGGVRIVTLGSALTGLAYWASSSADGWVAAAGFLMLLFVPVVTIGVIGAGVVNAWFDDHDRRTAYGLVPARRRRRSLSRRSCGACSASLVRVDTFWVCQTCDRVGVAP